MPFNFFKRSKKASNAVDPNEGASYTGESSRSAAQYNPTTKPEYKETAAQYNTAAYAEYQESPVAAADDPYAFLSDFDTVFLIDDSGSMLGESWNQTRAALAAIVPICTAHDADGIDIYFLNKTDSSTFRNVTSLDAVNKIFGQVSPTGWTPTGKRLDDIIGPYLKTLERARATTQPQPQPQPKKIKPLNIIVITDGSPTDSRLLENVIVDAATRLDALDAPGWQIGVQFFQVGGDESATKALVILDDHLKAVHSIRDMVDTVPWNPKSVFDGAFILKVVTGAVNRRLDRHVV